MSLLIVESPTKIKTLASILDGDWEFAVTKGHLYDLPEERMGIDEEYEPEWVPQNKGQIKSIRNAAESNGDIFIASDPDREGEAIAWQVQNLVLNSSDTNRMRLESLTEDEVKNNLESPEKTDLDLVHAQWARRILDRLAGYKISPFLIRAFEGKKLSAGRVQSAVLAKIVDRWKSVEEFEPETFYDLFAEVTPSSDTISEPLEVQLIEIEGTPVGTNENEQLLTEEQLAEQIHESVRDDGLQLIDRERKVTTTNPGYPFDSSEMLRRASSWFGWPSGKTMNVAQSLYEMGLITYHRSDSNRLSKKACGKAAGFIKEEYGEEYHQWRGGGGGDQEGHEAIRAKSPYLKPEDLHSVSSDQFSLYSAIWQRYVQSQMKKARWDTVILTFNVPNTERVIRFEGEARSIKDWGFYKCTKPKQTPPPEKERPSKDISILNSAEEYDVIDTSLSESETTGPRLYTEGSLIAMMKREGIGRPSTYSSTIDRLKRREYIRLDGKTIEPTQRGIDVCNFLLRAIPKICDVELTEEMENTLDEIARGEESWRTFVKKFDRDLERWIEKGQDVEPEGDAEGYKELLEYETCPRCDNDLYVRKGQYGKFVHCESEECDFSSNPPAKTYTCPECSRHMVKQKGQKSTVYHCIAHPDCEGKRPVGKPNMTYEEFQEDAPDCPECGDTMERRKSRYGNFWGCSNYPECEGTRSTK